jgi:hypothetical protein
MEQRETRPEHQGKSHNNFSLLHPCRSTVFLAAQNRLASDTYPDILIGPQLYSPNADFWKSRTGMPDPRSAFTAATDAVLRTEMKVQDVALKASAKVHEVKERALGRH